MGDESVGSWRGRGKGKKGVAGREEKGKLSSSSSRHHFDISVGQDMVDRETSLRLAQSQEASERRRELLEHSYSSLSDHHSYRQ